jgi:Zinc finger, C2H2 type.
LFQDREVKQKHEKNPSESSDFEEYEDEPPVIVVKKNNCEAVDDLADPLALSDTENNSQQKGVLDSCAGAAPSSLLNAEVIEKVPLIGSSETSNLRAVNKKASQDAAADNNSKITFKRVSQCKFIDVEDVIQKQREARKTQVTQVAKCTVSDVVSTCTGSERCVTTHITDSLNKKFTCSICSKGFSVKFSLKRHMFTHSYVKPFCCPNCNSAYSDKSNLIKHQRKRHSDVGLYTCSLCQAVFSSNSSLLRHRRTSHFVRTALAGPTVLHSDHDCYTKRERNYRNPRSKDSISKNVNQLTNEDKECYGEVIEHEEIDLKEESPAGFTDEGSKSPAGIDFPFVCNICFFSFQSYVEFDRHMTEHKQ